ncbi:methyltransferase [Nonomuraea longicatena]|uniref:Methyltransferase n=1 Tax=Nonomuraea longicatena TaxID=83682 RepID=A0ABN1R8M1_9ACTN
MPLFPNPVEAAAFRLSVVPPMLADYFGVLGFHSLLAGARLGVFDSLAARPATAADLSDNLGLDHHATAVLLRALTGLGYLRERRNRYRLTRCARTWLVRGEPACLVEGLEFWTRAAAAYWTTLEQAVRDGGPAVPLYTATEHDPELSRSFQSWTAALARRQAPATAAAVPVPRGATRLLDVGGGHALYSLALLDRHPRLHATVLDLPQALASAAPHPRVTPLPGSFLDAPLGTGYDVVLLVNVLHGLDDDQAGELLARVAAALNPGGVAVIGDQFRGGPTPGRASRTLLSLLDLNYLAALGGRVRTFAEVRALLVNAGFNRPRHRRPLRSPAAELAIATLPTAR